MELEREWPENFHVTFYYHQSYLEVCVQTEDQLGEGAAYSALANSFQKMGDTDLAIRYLMSYLDIATAKKQSLSQVQACSALGSIYSGQKNYKKAVVCLN